MEPVHFKQDNLEKKYIDWYKVPYSSYIHIELHKLKSEKC